MTNTDIKNLAKMKIRTSKKIIELCDQVAKVLAQFDGKSITGNKKRITDAIQSIATGLHVFIESEQYFGTQVKIRYFEHDRVYTTEAGATIHLDDDNYLIWHSVKDNTIHIDDMMTLLNTTAESEHKAIERAQYTARNIDTIATKAERFKSELWRLQRDTDNELTKLYNITF